MDKSEISGCPDTEAVANRFVRRTFRPATDTSLLFALFAQWFTDGFLRTKWEAEDQRTFRYNESNHEIDLRQTCGISELQTSMLRAAENGLLCSQVIMGPNGRPSSSNSTTARSGWTTQQDALILKEAHREWSDERLFQSARTTTIAVLLNITVSDYIVHIAPTPLPLVARPGMTERER